MANTFLLHLRNFPGSGRITDNKSVAEEPQYILLVFSLLKYILRFS